MISPTSTAGPSRRSFAVRTIGLPTARHYALLGLALGLFLLGFWASLFGGQTLGFSLVYGTALVILFWASIGSDLWQIVHGLALFKTTTFWISVNFFLYFGLGPLYNLAFPRESYLGWIGDPGYYPMGMVVAAAANVAFRWGARRDALFALFRTMQKVEVFSSPVNRLVSWTLFAAWMGINLRLAQINHLFMYVGVKNRNVLGGFDSILVMTRMSVGALVICTLLDHALPLAYDGTKRRWRVAELAGAVVAFFPVLFTGSRGLTFYTIVAVVAFLVTKISFKLNISYLAICFGVAVGLYVGIAAYRNAYRGGIQISARDDMRERSLSAMQRTVSSLSEEYDDAGHGQLLIDLSYRANGLASLSEILARQVSEGQAPQWGITTLAEISTYIPRIVWPDKPSFPLLSATGSSYGMMVIAYHLPPIDFPFVPLVTLVAELTLVGGILVYFFLGMFVAQLWRFCTTGVLRGSPLHLMTPLIILSLIHCEKSFASYVVLAIRDALFVLFVLVGLVIISRAFVALKPRANWVGAR